MTSQVTESLAVAATAAVPTKTAAQLISQTGVDAKEEGLATPSDRGSEDGPYYHQHIERNGRQVLVSWTKEEKRFGHTIMFAASWTLVGLIALYHPRRITALRNSI
ncbi:hypothetical protein F4818DRAFT_457725 [Hypoxylon cercidicola]|nr:hypothetical protein F4818DRAFT_457725 [Hypoxylon cercidicola]